MPPIIFELNLSKNILYIPVPNVYFSSIGTND